MDESIQEGATAPLPEPEATPSAPPMPEQVYAPTATAPAPTVPAASKTYSVPARWLVIGASVIAVFLLLVITFGIGVKVGAYVGRFDERAPGGMMRFRQDAPRGWRDDQRGWQGVPPGQQNAPGGVCPHGWDQRQDNIPGYGERGRGFPQPLPSPDATTQR